MLTNRPYSDDFIARCLAEFPDDDKLRRQLQKGSQLPHNTSLFCSNNQILDDIHPGEVVEAIKQMDSGDRTLLDILKEKAERASRRMALQREYWTYIPE